MAAGLHIDLPPASLALQKGGKDKQALMAARAKVSTAKGAVMQLKHDLEQMEAQKDLDKKLGGYHICVES